MGHMQVNMNLNDLADFVFKKNDTNIQVDLSINGIDNTRDLFCFCLDILCKGLILLFGKDNRVAIDEVSQEEFKMVQDKMRCVGIQCNLEVIDVELPPENLIDLWTQNFLNVQRVRLERENGNLEDYHFDLQTSDKIFKISFKILPPKIPEVPHNSVW
jgi:hypothetical protein